jgi:hypothetical protein
MVLVVGRRFIYSAYTLEGPFIFQNTAQQCFFMNACLDLKKSCACDLLLSLINLKYEQKIRLHN